MFRTNHRFSRSICAVWNGIFLIALLSVGFVPQAWAQDCEAALEDALESLIEQNYDRIIVLLTDCPPDRLLEPSQKIMAYRLLSLAYFVTDQEDSSRVAMNSLLDLEPDFDPQPPQYSDNYIDLLEEVRTSRLVSDKKRGLFRSKWFWIGGAAVTATTVYLIVGGKEETPATRLPDPPSFPVNQ